MLIYFVKDAMLLPKYPLELGIKMPVHSENTYRTYFVNEGDGRGCVRGEIEEADSVN